MKYQTLEGSPQALQREIAALPPARQRGPRVLRRLTRRALLHLEAQHPQLDHFTWGGGPRLCTLHTTTERYGLELELLARDDQLEARLCVEPSVDPQAPPAPQLAQHRELRYRSALPQVQQEVHFLEWLASGLEALPGSWAVLGQATCALQMEAAHEAPAPQDLESRRLALPYLRASTQGWALEPSKERHGRLQALAWRSLGLLGAGGSAGAVVAALAGWGLAWPSMVAALASGCVGVLGWKLAPTLPRGLPPAPGNMGYGLVLEKQRLTWGARVAHINLQRPFSVHLTRSPGGAPATACLLQITLHQKAQDADGTRLDLAVPALLTPQMMALPELRTHAPVLSPEDVYAWIWPVLHYSSSVHGLRLPMRATAVIPLDPGAPDAAPG